MPRLTAKYDQPAYRRTYPKRYLMDKNFGYPIEELARRHPDFARTFDQISKQAKLKLIYAQTPQQKEEITQQTNKLIWREILKTIGKN